MKVTTTVLLFLVLICSCTSQKSNKEIVLHPIVLKAKETSLYTDKIDWSTVNTTFIELTKDKETVEELKEGLQYLINSLGDKHAAFRSTKDHSIIVSYRGKSEPDDRDADFVNNVINDLSSKFSYELLDDKVGYLKLVAIGGGDVKEQADFIRAGLKDLKAKGANKWILDLRYNGGGNMNPMLSGLAPLIGEGYIGGAADANNNRTRAYTIKDGQFYDSDRLACEMDAEPTIEPTEKVAILLSRYTISSGELVAVAFKGRDHTRFIGEETAGYTTGNGYEKVTDELIMLISQDVYVDRNKKRYDGKVGVDDKIEFVHTEKKSEDKQIGKAIEWLSQ